MISLLPGPAGHRFPLPPLAQGCLDPLRATSMPDADAASGRRERLEFVDQHDASTPAEPVPMQVIGAAESSRPPAVEGFSLAVG